MSGVDDSSQDIPFLPRLVYPSIFTWPLLPVQSTCH